jgi:hypothetical protein
MKRHRNPDGSEGGLVSPTSHVDPTVYLGYDCVVPHRARVYGNVRIEGLVYVANDAIIDGRDEGGIVIRGNVGVLGKAHVSGFVRVSNEDPYRGLCLAGDVKVCGRSHARLTGPGWYETGTIDGTSQDMLDYMAEISAN